jgi:hypothetical protein
MVSAIISTLIVWFFGTWQFERGIKLIFTRTVAGALPIGQRRLVVVAIPYRYNRCYIRLALV